MHEFSCCHLYAKCNYGRNECLFEETEPSKKERCRCYQLKHSKKNEVQYDIFTNSKKENKNVEKIDSEQSSIEQLSLF